jgi:hypothetical protein
MSADITLAWMVSQLQRNRILDFDLDYVEWAYQNNIAQYGRKKEPVRPWALGRIDDSLTGIYNLTGRLARHPSTYYETDPINGKLTTTPCRLTQEHVHSSVRLRIGLHGKGLDDKGRYDPEALKGWKCKGVTGHEADIYWEREMSEDTDEDQPKRMPEDKLSDLERALLQLDPQASLNFWSIQA